MTITSRVLLVVLPAVALGTALPAAQSGTGVLASYARARGLLERAIAAHGGSSALNRARQVRVTFSGHDVWRNQSRRVDPPYDREPLDVDLMIDLDRGRLVFERINSFPGGAHVNTVFITNGDRGLTIDKRRGTHTVRQFPPADTQTGNLYYLPQFLLIKAREHAGGLRALGRMPLAGGGEAEVIATGTPQGPLTIAIDAATGQVRAQIHVVSDPLLGDAQVEIAYSDYRDMNGLLMPGRRIVRRNAEVTQELAITSASPGYQIPDAALSPPVESVDTTSNPAPEPVRTLAPGVWAIGGNTACLAVAFNDHVLVVDTPGIAADVISRLATLAPGKPVRYAIPTHHHDDHAGGIARFAAAGATIVTTARNRNYLERMALARSTLGPEVPSAPAGGVRMETIDRSRVFTDGARTVEIHNIGPSPHADDMFVAWLPREGILFQADLISTPDGTVRPGSNNDTTMHLGRWLRERGWNVTLIAGAHASVSSLAAFEQLLKQPLVPARGTQEGGAR